MTALFSSPKIPAPIPPPTATTDPNVAAAAAAQQAQMAQAAGRASTILTSGRGDTSAPTVARKTLLGQ